LNDPGAIDVSAERSSFVAEARTWLGTKYRHGSHIKGCGCDCATFIGEVLVARGLVKREELGIYGSPDWFHHEHAERYMFGLIRHAAKTVEAVAWRSLIASPGDIVLARVARSKLYNHAGIVVQWPLIIQAISPEVCERDASRDPLWAGRQVAVFDPFARFLELASPEVAGGS
jgi:cell wall-associated NlpC family hydrolase